MISVLWLSFITFLEIPILPDAKTKLADPETL